MASGAARAWAANRSQTSGAGTGVSAGRQSTSWRCRSAGAWTGSLATMAPASATTAASSVSKPVASRPIVPASKRSVLYSSPSQRRPSNSATETERSKRAVSPGAISAGDTRRSPKRSASHGTFCRANNTWNTGECARLRGGFRTSTSFSNGRSWWANASSVVARTSRSNVRNPPAPSTRVRNASVLAKKPTRPSSSVRRRPAMGVPTTMSCWPVQRESSTLNAANSSMKSVTPSAAASCRSRVLSSGDRPWPRRCPRYVWRRGRG